VAGKIVLCRCEDMTLSDLEHSVSRGYTDIEEVKRYTGFGTGPCQGKECLALVATQLAQLTGMFYKALADRNYFQPKGAQVAETNFATVQPAN